VRKLDTCTGFVGFLGLAKVMYVLRDSFRCFTLLCTFSSRARDTFESRDVLCNWKIGGSYCPRPIVLDVFTSNILYNPSSSLVGRLQKHRHNRKYCDASKDVTNWLKSRELQFGRRVVNTTSDEKKNANTLKLGGSHFLLEWPDKLFER
jgi:hypothetical protein